MIYIDKYAYFNQLKDVHPVEKFAFSITTLIITIASNSVIIPILTFVTMAIAILYAARIPFIFYGKLLLLPVFFLAAGVITIATNVLPADIIYSISMPGIKVGVSASSLYVAGKLFSKSMGAVSCLYFLTLTVPVTEIINILRKLKTPVLFLELLMLVYKFIFILLETINRIYISQNSRLGYRNYISSYRSLGKMIASTFIISLKRYQDIFNALESRCFTGDMHFYQREYSYSKTGIVILVSFESILFGINLVSWGKL